MVVSPLVEFHCRLHPLPTRSSSTRRLIGWRMATHETRFLMPLLIVQAFVPSGTTVPSADFCRTVRVNCSTLSPDSGTCNRSPAIRLTAFNAQPPNLPPAPLMDLDFAVIGQLVRRRRPHIRFLSTGSGLYSTLPSDPASRRQPLRFAITSPPSGCEGDLHPQAINHARRTQKRARTEVRALSGNQPSPRSDGRSFLFTDSTCKCTGCSATVLQRTSTASRRSCCHHPAGCTPCRFARCPGSRIDPGRFHPDRHC